MVINHKGVQPVLITELGIALFWLNDATHGVESKMLEEAFKLPVVNYKGIKPEPIIQEGKIVGFFNDISKGADPDTLRQMLESQRTIANGLREKA